MCDVLTALEPLMSHIARACNVSHEQVNGLPAILVDDAGKKLDIVPMNATLAS